MNNVVEYRFNDSEEWTPAIILSGTPDRKMLTIKNPGVLASGLLLRVNVGEDNNTANGCFTTEPVDFSIISKEDQDKPLNVDGKASIVKKNSSRSRFDDLNFEPVYNKDLSYSSFSITADENSLMQNVYSILLTNLGERLYDDEFGSTLEESVFEIIGDLNGESKLLNQCVTLINKYEPRAVVVEDKSYVAINEDNTVVIVLYIKVPRGVARKIELTFRKST
jgi:phage baseplate assembly protein W